MPARPALHIPSLPPALPPPTPQSSCPPAPCPFRPPLVPCSLHFGPSNRPPILTLASADSPAQTPSSCTTHAPSLPHATHAPLSTWHLKNELPPHLLPPLLSWLAACARHPISGPVSLAPSQVFPPIIIPAIHKATKRKYSLVLHCPVDPPPLLRSTLPLLRGASTPSVHPAPLSCLCHFYSTTQPCPRQPR